LVGSPPMNFIPATLVEKDGITHARLSLNEDTDNDVIDLSLANNDADITEYGGKEVVLGLRPEMITYVNGADVNGQQTILSNVDVVEPTGADTLCFLKWGKHDVMARVSSAIDVGSGDQLPFSIDMSRASLFDPQTEERI